MEAQTNKTRVEKFIRMVARVRMTGFERVSLTAISHHRNTSSLIPQNAAE